MPIPESDSRDADVGEDTAWGRWIALNGSRLMLFARQQTRCEADAEDVLQEAMVRLWRTCRSRGRAEEGDAPAAGTGSIVLPSASHAFAAIRRLAIDQARSRRRRQEREAKALGVVPLEDAGQWFEPGRNEEQRELAAAVRRLPGLLQEVIVLRIWGELTFQQIADALDIPMNTAASRYRYGLEHLRRLVPPTSG